MRGCVCVCMGMGGCICIVDVLSVTFDHLWCVNCMAFFWSVHARVCAWHLLERFEFLRELSVTHCAAADNVFESRTVIVRTWTVSWSASGMENFSSSKIL